MRKGSTYTSYEKYVNFIQKYRSASNAATGSQYDSNANVSNKNIATLQGELPKGDLIGTNRLLMINKLKELYPETDLDKQYIDDLNNHLIYKHDETSIRPYCVSISMYPFLKNGMKFIGGCSKAPQHLDSFCGEFINLVFAVASQFAGAVSTPEFLTYLDYFIRKDFGDDYYLRENEVVYNSRIRKTIGKIITDKFEQIVHSMNIPAAARDCQSVFWNIAYFDKNYFDGIFGDFLFPDETEPQWESVNWLQKYFMKWFNYERTRSELTFPVETLNLLNDGKTAVDQEWLNFAAKMYEDGHSFFTYTSSSVDSLASCCRLRNELQENTFSFTLGAGGVATGSKGVITMNVNRIVQDAVKENKDISLAIAEQTEKIHKYLFAFNEIIKDNFNARLLPVYDSGMISLDKQFLTIGINGFVEGAEFLGIEISPNEQYFEYGEKILKPIYELNKRDRTKEIMWNTEFVPRMSGNIAA